MTTGYLGDGVLGINGGFLVQDQAADQAFDKLPKLWLCVSIDKMDIGSTTNSLKGSNEWWPWRLLPPTIMRQDDDLEAEYTRSECF